MKLVNFNINGEDRLGVKIDQGIVDVLDAGSYLQKDDLPTNIMEVISEGDATLKKLDELIEKLDPKPGDRFLFEEDDIIWGPCVTKPNKIICVGLNYKKHADETKLAYPEVPILFNKFNNTLTGRKRNIQVPSVTEKLDYEVELGIIMGKETKDVSVDEALENVFGYCTANDLSARDLQMKTPQWLLGKTCDDFGPIGPYLVSSDEVDDPNNLNLKTYVNGEVRQNSNTSDMIFYCNDIVSYISRYMTLMPGDIILTGTPEGVVLGYPESQQVYLKPGDEVTVEIEKVGKLTNYFIE